MSGLNISNAHPRLYWGKWGSRPARRGSHVPRFPGWATIPGYYSLAAARDWHVLMAWPFAVGLLVMWLAMLLNRHFTRDLMTTPQGMALERDPRRYRQASAGSTFDHEGSKFNFLQKLAYGGGALACCCPGWC